MSGMNWRTAKNRDLVRQRGYDPVSAPRPPQSKRRPPKAPSAKQLAFLRELATQAGVPVPAVRTRGEAAKAIDRLLDRQPPTSKQRSYIGKLAGELGLPVPRPKSKREATREIQKLTRWLERREGR